MIEQYDGVISPTICSELINSYLKMSDIAEFEDTPDDKPDLFFLNNLDLCNYFGRFFYPYIDKYFSKAGLNVSYNNFELSDFCIFESSKGRPDHFDSSMLLKNGKQIFKPVVYLVTLNDDYSGGEIIFPSLKKCLSPKTGSLYLFPSNFLFTHYVTPSDSPRYVLRPEFKLKDEYWNLF